MKNKFTDSRHLSNEASVEDLFVARLIRDIGYQDAHILHKQSVEPAEIRLGSRRTRYSPDYILTAQNKPRVVVDAKAPGENIMSWIGQCVSYCTTINRLHTHDNPIRFFVLTNGLRTAVFDLDHGDPLIDIAFSECIDGNPKYEKL